MIQKIIPKVVPGKDSGVTTDNQPISRPCQSDVQSPRVRQEPNSQAFVGPHAGDNDVVLYLKMINKYKYKYK